MPANAERPRPKATIITPCYNSEKWIAETIDSVVAQTDPDWEHLIVDDGSPDGTAKIVREYAAREPRIKLISQANAGVSAARNTGLAHALGRYVAILDHDDKWHPEFLAAQAAALDAHPEWVGAVCGTQYFGGTPEQNVAKTPEAGTEYRLEHMLVRCAWAPVAALFRNRPGGQPVLFNPAFPCADDWDYWKQLLLHGPFGSVPRVLSYYRISQTQGSRKYLKMACMHLRAAEHFGRAHPEIILRYGKRKYHYESLNGAFLNLNDAAADGKLRDALGILFEVWRRPPFPLWTIRKALTRWLPEAAFGKRSKPQPQP